MATRIHLEDEGQDLLWLDVENGAVIDGGPYHGHLFNGRQLAPRRKLEAGGRIFFADGHAIRYPIVRIETLLDDPVLEAILAERIRQNRQWGGPAHDDGHAPQDWTHLLTDHAARLGHWAVEGNFVAAADYRQRLVKIAALAVAAIQAHDRARERGHPETQPEAAP